MGAGMQRFATNDQPGPFRPGGQVDQVGDLAYHGHLVVSVVLVDGLCGGAVLVEGRHPPVVVGVGYGHSR